MATKALATTHHDVEVDTPFGKTTVHYAEAGDKSKPVFLLLMGFPSSSTHYRDFIPLLADSYHVLAPDFPGFGATKAPSDFVYTFDNLATVVSSWLKHLKIKSYAMYIFDYGAPIGFRLALENPNAVKAIVSQNGNAYDEGLGKTFWTPLFKLWDSHNSPEARKVIRDNVLTQAGIMKKYFGDVPDYDKKYVDPEQPIRDYLQNIAGPENQERQLDLFYDYRTNVAAYPKWQQYLKESKVPVLAVWGKHDPSFVAAGAPAFKQHSDAEVHLIDAGHFALETARWEIADLTKQFLAKHKF